MPENEVVTVGEVMALLLAPAGVPLGEGVQYEQQHAGAESNVAVGLARLGHRVAFVSRLGDDRLGRRILRDLRGEGVDVSAVALDADLPTGLILRDALGHGIAVDYHRAGSAATRLEPASLPLEAIRNARVLHLTGITAAISESARACVLAAATAAREAGVAVTVDPNVRMRLATADRWRAIVEELTDLADVLLIGADDAASVGIDAPIAWAHERGVATVVLKDGARGATESQLSSPLRTDAPGRHGGESAGVWRQPALTVPHVVDPVGAGDAFAAGWLSAWLRGLDPDRRLAEAAAVAACVVGTRGDVPGLPDPATRDRLLAGSQEVAR
ncbi:sugar kinase [Pseudactinotalea terrae]|uniref:sugar kinase n=1 Tax=Pseudactinotalea terrae TaxID=1743262 RepID=UPI0012E15C07|nr:sugar kinase [Pseudactinotalea terrae]